MMIRTVANMLRSGACCASAGAAGGRRRMKEIIGWMRANPDEGAALMRENLSYIFFRELTGAGPLGALGCR